MFKYMHLSISLQDSDGKEIYRKVHYVTDISWLDGAIRELKRDFPNAHHVTVCLLGSYKE